jgi:hypothetical protein
MAPLPHSDTTRFLPLIRSTGHQLGYLPSTALFFTLYVPLPFTPPSDWLSLFLEPNLFTYKYHNNLIPIILPAYIAYEDGKERVFRNVGI